MSSQGLSNAMAGLGRAAPRRQRGHREPQGAGPRDQASRAREVRQGAARFVAKVEAKGPNLST